MTTKKKRTRIPGLVDRLVDACGVRNPSQLAKRLNMDASSVYQWRKGEGQPDFGLLIKISEETGYSIHYIIKGDGPKKASEALDVDRLKQQAVRDFLIDQLNVYSMENGNREQATPRRKTR